MKWLVGLTAVLAIGLFAFFLYVNSPEGDDSSLTAVVSDSINNLAPAAESEKVATSPSTTAPSRPKLSGFKEKELREGLDNIKAGLDLLQNPFE